MKQMTFPREAFDNLLKNIYHYMENKRRSQNKKMIEKWLEVGRMKTKK
jgi:hypothetical protein